MTDKQLYRLCKKYGARILEARRKFAGLLPEVVRRGLFERWGFATIYEFAARLAGMSRDQVDLVLRLEKRFQTLPEMHRALVEGEISPNKLVRLAAVAGPENQQEILTAARTFSSRALEILVKEMRERADLADDGGKPKFEQKSLHVQTLQLDSDVENELEEMQHKGIDINAFLRKVLQDRKDEISSRKELVAREIKEKRPEEAAHITGKVCPIEEKRTTKRCYGEGKVDPVSRYIPVKVRRILTMEHGSKCSIPGCKRRSENWHHTARFALNRGHSPYLLAPLCRGHHEIAHAVDVKVLEWRRTSR